MDKYRLLFPPDWLPWYLYPVWPLIWLRIRQLHAWMQANGMVGSMFLWSVDVYGRVTINHMSDDLSGRAPAPEPFAFQPSCSFRAILCGDEPGFQPLGLGMRGRAGAACNLLAVVRNLFALTPTPLPRERGLPLPET